MGKDIATRNAYGEVLIEIGKKNPRVVVLDADLSASTKTAGFGEAYPQRFFNMGIAEADMMGTAAGLAAAGLTPFASTFAVFATGRVFDQVRNSIAYPNLSVKIVATHGGITVGEDGASHQSVEDIALMRSLPNMKVVVPADAVETRKAVEASLKVEGPFYIRLGRSGVPQVMEESWEFKLGKGRIMRKGSDATIVAAGIMVSKALEAAEELAEEGLQVRIINLSTIKPVDEELLVEAARETGYVVTAEEHNIIGGLGSAVAEVLVENYPVPLKRVGIKDTFGESGPPELLLEKYGLTHKDIKKAVLELVK